jgi:dTDP-4-dehydrorhamnose reductase
VKVLITGANGQVGWELQRTAPADIEIIALTRTQLDITQAGLVNALIESERPDWVINAAAYTAVDKAETEQELAYRINRDGPANIAAACKGVGARMLQISTDFVFDGKQSTPYLPTDTPKPINVYGASKQAGDQAVQQILGDACTIVRTSWVYSSHGNNFVKTMLRLMAEREELRVVADQVGTPTWANGLARAIWNMVETGVAGVQHWSDNGVASWYDFAQAIMEEGVALGLLVSPIRVIPIPSHEYPTAAIRPSYTALDKWSNSMHITVRANHWREALREMLKEQ